MSNYSLYKKLHPFTDWLRYHFLEKRFATALGLSVLGLFAMGLAYCTVIIDYKIAYAITGFFLVALLLVLFIKFPYFGMYFTIVLGGLLPVVEKLFYQYNIPFGSATDLLTYLLLLSTLANYKFRKQLNGQAWNNPVTIGFLLLFIFYMVQAANPNMFSMLGWLSYTRKFLTHLCFFFACYCLLNSWRTMKFFITFNIVFVTLLAAYACKQQFFGLAGFELRWIHRSLQSYLILLQAGLLRKFSTLSDPASSGILFASVAMQCIVLFLRESKMKNKRWLAVAIAFNMLAYSFSGTRTATLMIVAGIAFYSVATINELRTLVFVGISLVIFIFIMTSPFNPPVIGRIRSTFLGTKDASAAVRDYNREQVLPYLHEHPMGGGIFTCGIEGPKYNQGHYLETFQPDSGYMKVLAEQGWIGLLFLLLFYFLAMWQGIRNFFNARDPELKTHSIALLTMVFTLMVGQYSQFAIGPEPQIFYYLGALIFFIKSPNYDKKAPHYETL